MYNPQNNHLGGKILLNICSPSWLSNGLFFPKNSSFDKLANKSWFSIIALNTSLSVMMPTTILPSLTTGSLRILLSCIVCNASLIELFGEIVIKGLLINSRKGKCKRDGFDDPIMRTISFSVIIPTGSVVYSFTTITLPMLFLFIILHAA